MGDRHGIQNSEFAPTCMYIKNIKSEYLKWYEYEDFSMWQSRNKAWTSLLC